VKLCIVFEVWKSE